MILTSRTGQLCEYRCGARKFLWNIIVFWWLLQNVSAQLIPFLHYNSGGKVELCSN